MQNNVDEVTRFFNFIFTNCPDGSGNINLRHKNSKGKIHSDFVSVDHIETIPSILSNGSDSNWWFGIALRNGNKGTKEDISLIPAVRLEHDNLNAEIEKDIEGFLKPSAIVQTSLPTKKQIYFLLKEPVGPEEIPRVEDINLRLITHFGGDKGTQDASRMLRIPGTFNHKKKYETPLQCGILELNPHCQYSLDDLDILPKGDNYSSLYNESHINNSERFQKIMGCTFLQHYDKDRATLPEPEWYAMVSILGRETEGPNLIHDLSKGYPQYSPSETDKKILHALNDTGPATCEHIKRLWDCGRECGVKSPAALTYKEPAPKNFEELSYLSLNLPSSLEISLLDIKVEWVVDGLIPKGGLPSFMR